MSEPSIDNRSHHLVHQWVKAISNPIRGLAEQSELELPWSSVSEEVLGNYYIFLHIKGWGFCSNRGKRWENKLRLLCDLSWQWRSEVYMLLHTMCVCFRVPSLVLKWHIFILLMKFRANVKVKMWILLSSPRWPEQYPAFGSDSGSVLQFHPLHPLHRLF